MQLSHTDNSSTIKACQTDFSLNIRDVVLKSVLWPTRKVVVHHTKQSIVMVSGSTPDNYFVKSVNGLVTFLQ
jgi:preprotein translocase subunit SecE